MVNHILANFKFSNMLMEEEIDAHYKERDELFSVNRKFEPPYHFKHGMYLQDNCSIYNKGSR